MGSGETIFRSPLDKPLDQLTEEDISQLTREDCRRYLKEKGMRRPSWNKSQAIQQVLSLKSLLEARTDSGAVIRQKVASKAAAEDPPHVPVTPTASAKETSADFQVSVSADESVSYRRKDPPKPAVPGDVSCRLPVADNDTISPRITGVANEPSDQMTIFYCGKVNVYDGVPANKAQAIMQLAASPICLPQDSAPGGTASTQQFPFRFQVTCVRPETTSSAAISPSLQSAKIVEQSGQHREEGDMSREAEPEVPTSRKASLQRYLEKRKDRGRFKGQRKIGGSSSSLEMYLNHQVRSQTPNGQSSRSDTSSPPQPRLPQTPTQCSPVENQAQNVGLSVDLNGNDVQGAAA
ncbi:PREDICTED: protein TIFY 4B-like isoform X2 [Nelumbo nucifera]|uniref:Protein TIFY n=1 Tax=Nelumbo nucifera TaxID=4432 RepID=A0A1U8A2X6_NELNU|nr:PREDICTED: protein TIFY 4B-like isoform X2 [Nelumbo nucifera]